MSTKRIIPCLDVKDGRVVKGINFVDFKDAGDPVEAAKLYSESLADELVFLDITASYENRKTILDVIERTAAVTSIPLTVGGGIRSVEDVADILSAGASRISINTAAVNDPSLINRCAERFGAKCVTVAIDAKKNETGGYDVYINGGHKNSGIDVLKWAKDVCERGAGEILLTSMDTDGVKKGYDIELTRLVAECSSLPVVASGGAGCMEDFYLALTEGKADAALAASLFHFKEVEIRALKEYLRDKGVPVRL